MPSTIRLTGHGVMPIKPATRQPTKTPGRCFKSKSKASHIGQTSLHSGGGEGYPSILQAGVGRVARSFLKRQCGNPRLPTCRRLEVFDQPVTAHHPLDGHIRIVEHPLRGPDAESRFACSFYEVAVQRLAAGLPVSGITCLDGHRDMVRYFANGRSVPLKSKEAVGLGFPGWSPAYPLKG